MKTAVPPGRIAGSVAVEKRYGEQGVPPQPKRPLSARDKRLLELVWTDGPLTTGELVELSSGLTSSQVTGVMQKLQARDLVLRTEQGWRAEG